MFGATRPDGLFRMGYDVHVYFTMRLVLDTENYPLAQFSHRYRFFEREISYCHLASETLAVEVNIAYGELHSGIFSGHILED